MPAYEMLSERYRSSKTVLWEARRRSDGLRVLVKSPTAAIAPPELLAALQREHELLNRLRGPGTPAVVELQDHGTSAALVLEDSGHERLPGGPLDLGVALHLAAAVVRVLQRVHAAGIVHLDVNPSNLVQRPSDADVMLIDFGIARAIGDGERAFMGTVAYCSPEQTGRTQLAVDHRSDLYSLGVTLFELLTGELPFVAEDTLGYVHAHLSKPPPPLRSRRSDVPEVVERIVARLLAKDPDARYQSARGLLHDLEACRAQLEATGSIETFELGSRDRTELRLADALVEREQALQAVLDQAGGLVVIAGPEGCGTSWLAGRARAELGDAVTAVVVRRARAQEAKPLGVLVRAVEGLANVILSGSDQELERWRSILTSALGDEARMLVDLVPGLAHVFGMLPDLPDVEDKDRVARRNRVFSGFFGVMVAERPVVLFLDDLHAADGPSVEVVESLVLAGLEGLTVIATRKSDAPAPELDETFARLADGAPGRVVTVELGPLSEAGVARLMALTLDTDEAAVRGLAAAMSAKTGGNPLFLAKLLERIQGEGILFRAEEGRWAWHADRLAAIPVSASVFELVVRQIDDLAPEQERALQIAACIGESFEEALVDQMAGGSTRQHLDDARDTGLVREAADGTWAFTHPRVSEALVGRLDAEVASDLHRRIARHLLDTLDEAQRAERLFEIVSHLERGRGALRSRAEREDVRTLAAAAAQQTLAASGHAIVARYLDLALGALTDAEWSDHPEQRHALGLQRAQCSRVLGDPEGGLEHCEQLLQRAETPLDRLEVHRLMAAIESQRGNHAAVLERTRRGLAEIGVTLPETPEALGAQIGERMGRMVASFQTTPPEELIDLPEVEDPVHRATLYLLFQAVPAAFQLQPPLFVFIELLMFELTVKHGVAPPSAKMFADCGIILNTQSPDPGLSKRLGELALRLVERLAPTDLESAVRFINGSFLMPWTDELGACNAMLEEAHRAGRASGDVEHAGFSIAFVGIQSALGGVPIPAYVRQLEEARAYGAELGASVLVDSMDAFLCSARALQGDGRALGELQAAHEARVVDAAPNTVALQSVSRMLVTAFFLGDLPGARRWLDAAEPLLPLGQGWLIAGEVEIFRGLVVARELETADDRQPLLEALEACEQRAASWARHNPSIFAAAHHLLAAELGRARGDDTLAVVRAYSAAVDARGAPMLHHKAYASERHASYWRELGQTRLARTPLGHAHKLYHRWGADGVVLRLESAHPELVAPSGGTTTIIGGTTMSEASLDVDSVVKATLAISSEIEPERLFAALMDTIVENAGAQHGCLVIAGPEGLTVEARAAVDAPTEVASVPLADAPAVARSVVTYVARTREAVVVGDAAEHHRFGRDPHVARTGVRSLLCLPVLSQGKLLAVVYAENNAVPDAFTQSHVRMLQVIAGQAATSIDNARMYERLEQLVAARTRELADRNREIEALFDNLPQGVFTVDAELRIQARYSARLPELLDLADPAGHDVMELFRDTGLTPDVLATHRTSMQLSFGVDAFLATLNWKHLIRRFARTDPDGTTRSFDVDWAAIVDEGGEIVRILATLRDVTQLRALEQQASERARELDILREVLQVGMDDFETFCRTARQRLAEHERMLADDHPRDASTWQAMYRQLHTVKGNARTLGFAEIAAAAHTTEEPYSALRQDPSGAELPALRDDLASLSRVVDDYEATVRRVLGDWSRSQASAAEEVLAEIERAVAEGSDPAATVARVAGAIARFRQVTVDEVVRKAGRGLPSLARELGREDPEVVVIGGGIGLTAEVADALADALVHVLRNAMDHGIEEPPERAARGKPARGRVEIAAEQVGGRVVIRVSDDGRGLAIGQLRERLGGAASDEQAADSVFVSGTSTATRVTAVSGRGVGMDAVRSFLVAHGGAVRIELTGAERDGRRPFVLHLEVPAARAPVVAPNTPTV